MWRLLLTVVLVVGCGKKDDAGSQPSPPDVEANTTDAAPRAKKTNDSPRQPVTPLPAPAVLAPPKLAAFNPADPEESLRWVAAEYDKVKKHDPMGNLFVGKTQEQVRKEFDNQLSQCAGKQIKWPVAVSGIGADGRITVKLLRYPKDTIPEESDGDYHYLELTSG